VSSVERRSLSDGVDNSRTPVGRDEVRSALVASATRLFNAESPGKVAIKTIAAEAGVNHGLVHRHIGSKLDLAKLVLEAAAALVLADVGDSDDPVDQVLRIVDGAMSQPVFSRVLAWAMLEGIDAAQLQSSSGLLREARTILDKAGVVDAAQATADIAVATLGWTMYEDYLLVGPLDGRDRAAARQAQLLAIERNLRALVDQDQDRTCHRETSAGERFPVTEEV